MESITTLILNKILGRFIKGFDYQKFKFSLSGNLDLQHLELRDDVLDYLDLPFFVKFGIIDKIHLKIPWYSMYKDQSLIEIDGLHILITPKLCKEVC